MGFWLQLGAAEFAGAILACGVFLFYLCRKGSQLFMRSSGYCSLSFLIQSLSPSYELPPVLPGVEQARTNGQSLLQTSRALREKQQLLGTV